MVSQNVLLTTSKRLILELDSSKVDHYLPPCSLQWRNKKLWVKANKNSSQDFLPALKRKEWLRECLQNSIVEQVCLDSRLGIEGIKLWADVCQESQKPVFLRISSQRKAFREKKSICWKFKRVMDWLVAAILLLLFSPVMLTVAALIKILTPGAIFCRHWQVGNRGQLFQVYRFRTMILDTEQQSHQVPDDREGIDQLENNPPMTPLGKWLRKFSLDELPLLFNVLRGEMSLVGPRTWALSDALHLGKTSHTTLPGITGAWQAAGNSHLLDWDAANQWDLKYLDGWSLDQDLKILLMTIPKLIFGFSAY